MERFRKRTRSILLKDDNSTTELLPVQAESDSYDEAPLRDSQDPVKEQSHKGQLVIKGWPGPASSLGNRGWEKAGILALDSAIALIPLLFMGKSPTVRSTRRSSNVRAHWLTRLVLSIAAISLSGSPIGSRGDRIKAATNLGPTIFPILFAAIVGRSLRSLASYHAERGAKLGRLEQLMGSLTIFGTVELQFLLRTFDILGIGLIALWALSPLGGQASLRLLGTGQHSNSSVQNLSYLGPDYESLLGLGGDSVPYYIDLINALYFSALLTPPAGQASSVDTWANVKIPAIENLESTSKSDADGWYDVRPGNTTYSSLVGLPIDGIRKNGSYHFYVESLYMVLDCPNISYSTLEDGSSKGGFSLNFVRNVSFSENLQLLPPNQTSYPAVKPWGVNFNAVSNLDVDDSFIANCTLTRSSVESNITCDHGSCSVTNIRRSQFDRRPPGYTPLFYGTSAGNFEEYWPMSGSSGAHEGSSTPTEYFLADPTMQSLASNFTGEVSLAGLSADLFSERFSLVFNTYWQCNLVPWYRTGNLPSNISALNKALAETGDGTFNTTTTTVTNFTDVYVCNKMWAAILLIASTLLLVCGMCGAIVKYRARGPRILGYVSTMTRDNPYIDLPPGGCTLDGLDRARLLKNMEVRLQDVAAEDEVGHIALGLAQPSEKGDLILDRLYAGAV